MSDTLPPITIQQLEHELRAITTRYLASLSTTPVKQPERIRLEATGDGVSVMYETDAPDGIPHLVVSLTQKVPR